MAKIKRVIRCHQCGVILQSEDPKAVGYIEKVTSESYLASNPEAILYCNSCYNKIKEMNNSELTQQVDEDILKILDDAVASDAVIVYVVDLFSFSGIFKEKIIKKIKGLDVYVVATKRDYFPSSINNEVFQNFVNERFKEVKITPKAVHIISNHDSAAYKNLVERVAISRQGHDVYMIGDCLSGKTTFLNNCLKYYTNKSKREIRTITYPGTSSKVLEIPFNNSTFLYELPSLPLDNSASGTLEKDVQRILIPRKEIQTPTFTVNKGESILVGGLSSFTIVNGKQTKVKVYVADEVEFKKVSYTRLRETMLLNRQKRNIRPVSDRLQSFRDYDVFDLEMENDGLMHDITVNGLGTYSFVAKGQTIRVMLPKGTALKEYLAKVR